MTPELCRSTRVWIVAAMAVCVVSTAWADELWVPPSSQQDFGGLTIASGGVWPVTPAGAVRLAWAVPNDLQEFQGAKLVLIPRAPAGASTLNVIVCAAQHATPSPGACGGAFTQSFTGVANQLVEVDISAMLAPRIGTAGATYLAVLAYTTPNTATDQVLGLRFTYAKTRDTRVFRYMTFDTYLEACCWNADNNASLFGGVNPSTWTDGDGQASQMSSDPEILRALFVRKLYPGKNALVSSERWNDSSSTNGKVTAVLMRIRNNTSSAIAWQPSFYFTAHASWGERASVAVNGVNAWNSAGDHYANSTAAPTLTLPANQTSTVIFVVPSSPPWFTGVQYRMNFFAFHNDSLNLPPGLFYVDDLDGLTGTLW